MIDRQDPESWRSQEKRPYSPLEKAVLTLRQAGKYSPNWSTLIDCLAQAYPARIQDLAQTAPEVYQFLPQLLDVTEEEPILVFPERDLIEPTVTFMRELHDCIEHYAAYLPSFNASKIAFSIRLWQRRLLIYIDMLEQH